MSDTPAAEKKPEKQRTLKARPTPEAYTVLRESKEKVTVIVGDKEEQRPKTVTVGPAPPKEVKGAKKLDVSAAPREVVVSPATQLGLCEVCGALCPPDCDDIAPKDDKAEKQTIEKWAEEKGMLPQFIAREPTKVNISGIVRDVVLPPKANPRFWIFAAAKPLAGWLENQEVTEHDFDVACHRAQFSRYN